MAEEPEGLIVKANTGMHSFHPLMEEVTRALYADLSFYSKGNVAGSFVLVVYNFKTTKSHGHNFETTKCYEHNFETTKPHGHSFETTNYYEQNVETTRHCELLWCPDSIACVRCCV